MRETSTPIVPQIPGHIRTIGAENQQLSADLATALAALAISAAGQAEPIAIGAGEVCVRVDFLVAVVVSVGLEAVVSAAASAGEAQLDAH